MTVVIESDYVITCLR